MDLSSSPSSLPSNPLSGDDGQLMVMAAHRYCLGRRSYIVRSCISWLTYWWSEITEETKRVILRDTVEALQDNLAGDAIDFAEWKTFAENVVWPNLSEESKKRAKNAVAYRKKDWPLKEAS